jgi:hypothetical protein
MDRAERLQFYMEMYDFEHEQRKALRSDVGSSITVLLVLAGGLFFYIRNVPVLGWQNSQIMFVALLIIAGVILFLAMCCLARAWWSREAGYLAPPPELETWHATLESDAKAHGDSGEWVANAFADTLIKAVATSTKNNRTENAAVSQAAYYARGLMLCGLVLLALNLPFYYFCTYHYGRAGARAVHSEQRKQDVGREEDGTATQGAAAVPAPAASHRVLPGRIVQADALPLKA